MYYIIPDKRTYLWGGIDEVGSGSWAGPLVVGGAVIYEINDDGDVLIKRLDSKKLGSMKRRLEYFRYYLSAASVRFYFAMVSSHNVDDLGLGGAKRYAVGIIRDKMRSDFGNLRGVIMDGDTNYGVDEVVIKGDERFHSMAIASVASKIFRDKFMINVVERLMNNRDIYSWKSNKGYYTDSHRVGVQRVGLCEYHRRRWIYSRRYGGKDIKLGLPDIEGFYVVDGKDLLDWFKDDDVLWDIYSRGCVAC